MDIKPINAYALENLFHEQIEYGATDFFAAFEDALQDTPILRCEECPNYDAAFDCRSSCPNCEKTLSLNPLRDAIYQDAVAHGLWEEADAAKDVLKMHDCCVDIIADEVCEMGEAWDDKDAFEEELADTIIASFSVAGYLGIDIDAAIRRKMEINKKRPWKHGKEGKV